MSPADILGTKLSRGIYLVVSKWPKWLNITLYIIFAILPSFILTPIWAICISLLILVIWAYGKNDVQTTIEKFSGAKAKAGYQTKYVTGLPQFPKPVDNMVIKLGETGIVFKQFLLPEVTVPFQVITKIEAETKTQITRTASMFKGAVGLALAGPIGGMIGMGIGSKHDDSVNFVTITYKDELGEDNLIVLQQGGLAARLSPAQEIATKLKEARKQYLLSQKASS